MTQANDSKFDQAYYERFYVNPETRAASPSEQTRQAHFIAAYLDYLELDVRRIVDIGCGLGNLLHGLAEAYPDATCHGVEFSQYLCDEYGWTHGSVENYRARRPYDLVVCTDVLGYLDDTRCAAAIENLTRLTRGALYLSVLTEDDMDICDQEHTDLSQALRSASWYREQLAPSFTAIGGGLFLKEPLPVSVWALERAL